MLYLGERLGYRAMNQKRPMKQYIKVAQDLLYAVMQESDDEGLDRRKPIMKKSRKR